MSSHYSSENSNANVVCKLSVRHLSIGVTDVTGFQVLFSLVL